MSRSDRIVLWVLAGGVGLAVCAGATFKEYSPDTPLHLKLGEIILHERHIPDKAVFLFTHPDHPWLDHEWLFQAGTYLIHWAGGISGLIAVRLCLALLIAGLLWHAAGNAHPLAKGAALLCAVPVLGTRLCIRPELLTLLFLATCLLCLERWNKRYRYLLPAVFIVWANVHAFFVGGLVLILAYAVCATLGATGRPADAPTSAPPTARELWLLLLCCALACLVNPFFHRGAVYPITELIELGDRRRVFFGAISELASPFARQGMPGDDFRAYRMLVYLTALSFGANARGCRRVHMVSVIAAGLASFRVGRNIGLFAVVAAPALAHNLNGFGAWLVRRVGGRLSESRWAWVKYACAGLLAMGALGFAREVVSDRYHVRLQTIKRFGTGWSEWVYPKRAADFLEARGFTGRLFNDFETGSYLIWRAYPRRQVFINGNTSYYPPEFFGEYQKVKSGEVSPSQAARKHGLDGFLLSHFSGSEAVVRKLAGDRAWRLAHWDELVCVFLRRDSGVESADEPDLSAGLPDERAEYDWAALRALRACGLLPPREVVPLLRIMRAKFLLAVGRSEAALADARRAAAMAPSSPQAQFALGEVCYGLGLREEAKAAFARSASAGTDDASPYTYLGLLYQAEGDMDRARRLWQEALRINPHGPVAHNTRGILLMLEGKYEGAEAEFRAALAARPDMAAAKQNLQLVIAARKGFANISGLIGGQTVESADARAKALVNAGSEHAQAGREEEALKCYRQAIALAPHLADAHYNLGNLHFRAGRLAEAAESYGEALRLNPNDAEARFRLGGVYVEQKRWREAEAEWVRALALNPGHEGARRNLTALRQLMAEAGGASQDGSGGRPHAPAPPNGKR